jgi:tetratricopeptide (TPR) repeat protein
MTTNGTRNTGIKGAGASALLSLTLIAGAIGCAGAQGPSISPQQLNGELQRIPAPLRPQYTRMRTEGKRNEVLNLERLGLAALETGDTALAANSFEVALSGIEAVYADTDSAKRARSLWHAEGSKDFKGEPYERAMAYMYRGILYLGAGDNQNARASFKAGQLQDQIAEEDEFRSDFAALDMLSGFASQCDGDAALANTYYESAAKQRPGFVRPAAGDNLLIVAETGSGPVKYATGNSHEELRFRRGTGFVDESVALQVDGHEVHRALSEDIYFQASTRGSRPIDKILAGHAQFKEGNEVSGKVLSETGLRMSSLALQANNVNLAGAGAIIALFGVGQQLVAAAMTAEADTRTWESLPDQVHIATARVRPGAPATVDASFLTATGTPISGASRSDHVSIGAGKCGIVWLRSGSAAGSVTRNPVGVAVSAAQ